MVTLGQTVTGFSGKATAHCRYITGCDQILVQPAVKEGGEFVEQRWFDITRLDPSVSVETDPGADIPAPIK